MIINRLISLIKRKPEHAVNELTPEQMRFIVKSDLERMYPIFWQLGGRI
jgi:hypothetical protein